LIDRFVSVERYSDDGNAGKPADDGETGTRTRDTTIFSRVLYQLSYLAVAGRC
jgi:hypothetical protein